MYLSIDIPEKEFYNRETNRFTTYKPRTLRFEYSLYTISLWEMKYHESFFTVFRRGRKNEQIPFDKMYGFIKCMCLDDLDDVYFSLLEEPDIIKIKEYMENPMTATIIKNAKSKKRRNVIITTEEIYYYMTALNIPFECEHWHYNRLETLIYVCSEMNNQQYSTDKKPKRSNAIDRYAINEKRKKELKTTG